MQFKLGKKPARPDAVLLKAASYFDLSALPKVPAHFGHPWVVRVWGMLGNDFCGDCVWAGAAHETVLLHADAPTIVPTFTSKTVMADYSAVTGFNPHDMSTDQGTDVQEAAEYRQKTGIVDILGHRHKIDLYAEMRCGDLEQLAMLTYLNAVTGIGVQLPSSAEYQFNRAEIWDVIPGAHTVGGHYIPCVGRNSLGQFLFVTWGRLQAATGRWVQEYMDEGVAYLSRARLGKLGLSPQGFNEAQLTDDFKQVTGTA